MLETIINSLAVVLQVTAVILALRLISITRGWKAWILLAAAMIVMSLRRLLDLFGDLSMCSGELSLIYDISGTVVSALVVLGIYHIRPLFLSLKHSTAALQASEEKFRSLVNSMDDIVFTLDHEQRFTGIYGRWYERHEMCADDYLGRRLDEVVRPEKADTIRQYTQRAFAGEFVRYGWFYQGSIGEFAFETSLTPLIDSSGAVIGIVGFARDITRQKELQNERRYLLTEVEHAKQLADDMVLATERLNCTLETIVETMPVGVAVCDNDGRYMLSNSASRYMCYGTTRLPMTDTIMATGARAFSMHYSDGREIPEVERPLVKARRQQIATYGMEMMIRQPDGKEVCTLTSCCPIYDAAGDAIGAVAVMQDISERKRAEEALHTSEARFRTTFENAGFAMAIADKQGVLRDANAAFQKLFGYTADELHGVNFADLTYPAGRGFISNVFHQCAAGRLDLYHVENQFLRKDGEMIWGVVMMSCVRGADEDSTFSIVMLEDITQRKKDEEAIRQYQTQLRLLTAELASAEDRERRRIATGMHDHITQALSFSYIEMGALREMAAQTGIVSQIDKIRTVIGKAAEDCQSLTFELSPPVLYELGVCPAVEYIAEHFQQQYGISIDVQVKCTRLPINDDLRALIFRAIQELLVNIVKHANAEEVTIQIDRVETNVRVVVTDNGQGFDTAVLNHPNVTAKGGYGLFSIHERMRHIGGAFTITSAPNRGTEVHLTIPISQDIEDKTGYDDTHCRCR